MPENNKNTEQQEKLTLDYLLQKIEEISKEQPYISDAIKALENVKSGGPGDVGAQAQAHALGEIVKAREATNQKLLSLYEKMYDDLKAEKLDPNFIIRTLAQPGLSECTSAMLYDVLNKLNN